MCDFTFSENVILFKNHYWEGSHYEPVINITDIAHCGGHKDGSQRCLCWYPWNLWICYLTYLNGICSCDWVPWEGEIVLYYSGGPSLITYILRQRTFPFYSQKGRCDNRRMVREMPLCWLWRRKFSTLSNAGGLQQLENLRR